MTDDYSLSRLSMNQPATPITAPSLFTRFLDAIKEGRILSGLKKRLRPAVIRAGHALMKLPRFRRVVAGVLNHTPNLKLRIYRILWSNVILPPRALRIYTDLKTRVDQAPNRMQTSKSEH